MEGRNEEWNVLVILSITNFRSRKDLNNAADLIEQSSDQYFCYHTIIDPNQEQLENIIQAYQFLFVLNTCRYASIKVQDEKVAPGDFDILQLLSHLNLDLFGNDYASSLFAGDLPAVMKSASPELRPGVITRHLNQAAIQDRIQELPVEISLLGTKHVINSPKSILIETEIECIDFMQKIFAKKPDLGELLIHSALDKSSSFVVSIIGNPPRNICLICKSSSSGISVIENDAELVQNIKAQALELFERYGLNGFGKFEFQFKKGCDTLNLIAIDVSNIFNKHVLTCLQQKYDLGCSELLNIVILTQSAINTGQDQKFSMEVLMHLIEPLPRSIVTELLPLHVTRQLYKHHNYRDVRAELTKRFLSPEENNRNQLIKLIKESIANIPKSKPNSPFLEVNTSGYSFLNDYEELPHEVQNEKNVLIKSLEILRGQLRWHSPSLLYNVFPSTQLSAVASSAITNLFNPVSMTRVTSAGVLDMEKQIVRQMANLIGWDIENAAGHFTYGGKACMTYGIKLGLNRCSRYTNSSEAPVVICSEVAHFSIETVCHQLGISGDSIIRIPLNSHGCIDFGAFEKWVDYLLALNTPIACVIFSGGNTTHNEVEDVETGYKILASAKQKYSINYNPFIYFDLVVGWPWLFFKFYDFELNQLEIDEVTLRKIEHVKILMSKAHLSDGYGIDFHKAGFTPHSNSLFIAKQAVDLHSIFDIEIDEQFREPYHHTFSNSRGSTAILAAWNVLQSTGIEGFQSYIANMISVATTFADQLPKAGFEVLRKDESTGFATIVWVNFVSGMVFSDFLNESEAKIKENNKLLYSFTKYLGDNNIDGQNKRFFVRYLDDYMLNNKGIGLASFVVLPMTIQISTEHAARIAWDMGEVKVAFESRLGKDPSLVSDDLPVDVPR